MPPRKSSTRHATPTRRPARYSGDPNVVRPATRQETLPIGLAAVVFGLISLSLNALHGTMLLYGDAVAHLGIARRIVDTNSPGLANWGGVWLPLPHLLMLPFIGRMQWWQNGMAGAWPSLLCYIVGCMGLYRLARRVLIPAWALVATAFFGLNANLLYLATTAMTEPLFLALLVWIILLLLELREAVRDSNPRIATNRLMLLGVLHLAAVMTRYDGWILAAAVWLIVAWQLWHNRSFAKKILPGFATFTILTVIGPVAWFDYNHIFGHDWLDFMRGPYSAREIDRKTSPPGAHKYWGWHNPAWSLMLYARTAQVDSTAWEFGWLVAAGALWGAWKAWYSKLDRAVFLLWLPLPFYVYSIAYGSVPIFIPQLYPHSYYNSRYGMEMLPCLGIFCALALAAAAKYFSARAAQPESMQKLVTRFTVPVMLLLIVVNLIVMVHETPLVLKEAEVNSRGRLAIEDPLAEQLAGFVPGARILMDNSSLIGALQKAGVPLRQTIGPGDWYGWRAGMQTPAEAAQYAVAASGDEVSKAIAAHPEGLTELSIVCSGTGGAGKTCVRIYKSDRYQPH